MDTKPSFKFELDLSSSHKLIAGIDEVGRGSLAGPIVAAAVIFGSYKTKEIKGVDDSKKLSASDRNELDEVIRNNALDFAFGAVSVQEIDKFGIGAANIIAFKRAIDNLKKCDFALIDGRKFRGFEYPYLCLEKGESKSISIAAASIIAKVYRDKMMELIGQEYPEYDFVSNKGYGSPSHLEVLKKLGPTIHHRKTFLKFLEIDANPQLF